MASTVWRGYISFGLITIPVRLFRAARAERVSLRRLYREPNAMPAEETTRKELRNGSAVSERSLRVATNEEADSEMPSPARAVEASTAASALTPVKQASVQASGDVAAPANIVKGYEFEKNRFVALEPEELKSVAPATSSAMEIAEFVQLAEVDPVYLETSYYVAPEEAGEKAYALLYRSMQLSGLVAIAQFAMHGREHAVILRPGRTGVLAHTMFFASEVRADEEFHADTSELNKKELDLAQTLINSLAAKFEPGKYRDTYREKIEELIQRKVNGQPVAAAAPVVRQADVIDIADALRQSLANLKKPPSSVPSAAAKPRSRKKSESEAASH